MSQRYSGLETRTYEGQTEGHIVELEFNKKLIIINRAKLRVDGRDVDQTKVFYGEKTLTTELDDGTTVEVVIDSGGVGELTRAQLKQPNGSWTDLQEQPEL